MNPVSGPASPSALGIWVSACRPRTLSAAVAPVVVGSALAAHDHRFDPLAAGICLAFALLCFAPAFAALRSLTRGLRPGPSRDGRKR